MNEATGSGRQINSGFQVVDGSITVGGVPLARLAARVGATPFFAYDRRLISERVESLRRVLPAEIHLSYAIKANPMPAVVQHLAGLVDGFDVASAGELKTVLDTPMMRERVSFAGPGKRQYELKQALAAGVTVNVESGHELDRLAEAGQSLGVVPRVCLRINPDFDLRASGMRMGGGAKQFGIDLEEAPAVLGRCRELGVDFQGFHVYAGSQNLNAEAICQTLGQIIDLAVSLSEHATAGVRQLNMGGGFGIPYFAGNQPLDLAAVADGLAALMSRAHDRLPEARLVLELGRYFVGEAGIYVCRIVDRKVSRGQIFLVTDGGLHHHLAASGNFGQVARRNFPVAVGNRMDQPSSETVSVVGCLCTPLDLLADKVELPGTEVGDFIVIFQSGAYAMTASPKDFLSHPSPIEVLL